MFDVEDFKHVAGVDFLTELRESMYEGLELHNESLELMDRELGIIASSTPSIYAKVINHFIYQIAKQKLAQFPHVKFKKFGQKNGIVVGKFVICFNKLDRERNKAANSTTSDKNYRAGRLFSDDRLIPLYAGYILDGSCQKILNTYVIYKSGSTECLNLNTLVIEKQLNIAYKNQKPKTDESQEIKTNQNVILKISTKKDQQDE